MVAWGVPEWGGRCTSFCERLTEAGHIHIQLKSCVYTYTICLSLSLSVSFYIYIYRERERQRKDRERERERCLSLRGGGGGQAEFLIRFVADRPLLSHIATMLMPQEQIPTWVQMVGLYDMPFRAAKRGVRDLRARRGFDPEPILHRPRLQCLNKFGRSGRTQQTLHVSFQKFERPRAGNSTSLPPEPAFDSSSPQSSPIVPTSLQPKKP